MTPRFWHEKVRLRIQIKTGDLVYSDAWVGHGLAHRECSSRRRAGLLLRRVPEDLFEKAGRPGHMLALIKAVTRAAFLEGHQCVELLLPVGGNRQGALGRAVRGWWRGREWRGVGHGERGEW
eukprot:scaffold21903_cov58-Phaeocystis_antarctica.AAC.3